MVQEAFVRCWSQTRKFNPHRARFTTWLYRIVVNLCIDQNRRQIEIDIHNVFSAAEAENRPIRLFADCIHITSHESVIRHELLFKEGDRYSHRLLEESARLLRRKPYLYDAAITKLFRGASFEGFEMDFSCTQIRAVGH